MKSEHKLYSKEWWREYRLKNLDKLRVYKRGYDREMYKKFPERENARRKRWALKNPEKAKAQMILNAAVQNGTVLRGWCEMCREGNTHGHHDDYSKPLEVRWLCPKHHSEEHRKKKQPVL